MPETSSARQSQASHVVGIGIHPIIAFAVQSSGTPLSPGASRLDQFAITSNLDDARMVAHLDSPLPDGLSLSLYVETDLASISSPVTVRDDVRVTVVSGLMRGKRRGQSIRVELAGVAGVSGTVERKMSIGIEDPSTGTSSWQTVPITIVLSGAPE